MIVGGIYSFNNGQKIIEKDYPNELAEIVEIIQAIDDVSLELKVSTKKTMLTKVPFKLNSLSKSFQRKFEEQGWASNNRIFCDEPTDFYILDHTLSIMKQDSYREMDFVKNGLGVDIHFSKNVPTGYHGCAKMTIFHNEGLIDVGVEIVPLKELAAEMSTGVSYFEQFVWDLEHRGVSDIDIPVLILGIAG